MPLPQPRGIAASLKSWNGGGGALTNKVMRFTHGAEDGGSSSNGRLVDAAVALRAAACVNERYCTGAQYCIPGHAVANSVMNDDMDIGYRTGVNPGSITAMMCH